MAIEAKVLADSIAPNGRRLITMEWTYPRAIHSEIMTHRMLSRNAASSRAIPTEKLIQRVDDDPWIPSYIGQNQRGMQAGEELDEKTRKMAVDDWLRARDAAVNFARGLARLGVHKQVVNRIIEPWMWITVIVSATEWKNFFGLRDHEMAEPHFQELARKARVAMTASIPQALHYGKWHLPLIQPDERVHVYAGRSCACDGALDDGCWQCTPNKHARPADLIPIADAIRVSVGRCARVSYLTHDGRRSMQEDIALHDRLVCQVPLHASPLEHVAMAMGPDDGEAWSGNFRGWKQYRKTLAFENLDAVPA